MLSKGRCQILILLMLDSPVVTHRLELQRILQPSFHRNWSMGSLALPGGNSRSRQSIYNPAEGPEAQSRLLASHSLQRILPQKSELIHACTEILGCPEVLTSAVLAAAWIFQTNSFLICRHSVSRIYSRYALPRLRIRCTCRVDRVVVRSQISCATL
jgi:hypothetical protein